MSEVLADQRNAQLFEQRLYAALNVALGGQTALVIVPRDYPKRHALTRLTQLVPTDRAHQVRMPGTELHFEGTRGSVRVYACDHITYHAKQKRLLDYPHGIPTFLHPEVEGL